MRQSNADDKEWARKKLDADLKWADRRYRNAARNTVAKEMEEAERKKRMRKRIVIGLLAYLVFLLLWQKFK